MLCGTRGDREMIRQHHVILAAVWITALTVLVVWIIVFRRLRRFMKKAMETP